MVAGIPPIDLRLSEITIREVAKINAKTTEHPLKLQQEPNSTFIGPLFLALSQAAEMQQVTNINTGMIQQSRSITQET